MRDNNGKLTSLDAKIEWAERQLAEAKATLEYWLKVKDKERKEEL